MSNEGPENSYTKELKELVEQFNGLVPELDLNGHEEASDAIQTASINVQVALAEIQHPEVFGNE